MRKKKTKYNTGALRFLLSCFIIATTEFYETLFEIEKTTTEKHTKQLATKNLKSFDKMKVQIDKVRERAFASICSPDDIIKGRR